MAFVTGNDISEIFSDIYMTDFQNVEFQNLSSLSQLTIEMLEIDPQFQSLLKIHTEVEDLLNARLTDVISQILTESNTPDTDIFSSSENESQPVDGENERTAAAAAAS